MRVSEYLAKYKHYLGARKSNTEDNLYEILIKTYVYICANIDVKTMQVVHSIMSNLQLNCCLKIDFHKVIPARQNRDRLTDNIL